MRRLWTIVGLASLVGCLEPDVITLRLVPVEGLSPERDFTSVALRVYDDATGEIVAGGSGTLSSTRNLAKANMLRVGARYRLLVIAETRDVACTLRGRAVGRSLPFEHREEPYDVFVQMGCADELAPTRGQPAHGRLLQSMTPTRDGGAVVAGGFGALGSGDFAPESPIRPVERYDGTTGRWSEVGELGSLRLLAPAIELDDGRVAVVGGLNTVFGTCLDNLEVVWPEGASPVGRLLEAPRCGSRALRLRNGIGIFGGTPPPALLMPPFPRAELHDGNLVGDALRVTGGLERSQPAITPIAGGRGAIVGGGQELGAPFEVFLEDCGGGAPCFLPIETSESLPAGWTDMTLTYATCDEGGGAVFAVGGVERRVVGDDLMEDEVDHVWCWLDRPDGGVFRPTTRLPAPRGYHQTAALRTAEGTDLLVVGSDEALRIPVDPCTCQADFITVEDAGLPLPPGPFALLHAMVTLRDETILVHGGISTFLTDETMPIETEASSWLFVPDVNEALE